MSTRRRIFVSLPGDRWLSDAENDVKWAIVERIEGVGLSAEIFLDPRGTDSLSAPLAWSAERAEEIMRRCVGAATIGLPRWTFDSPEGVVKLASEFCHYEGAIARALQLPTLVVAQTDVLHRLVFDSSFGGQIAEMPPDADRSWLDTKAFGTPFAIWQRQLEKRRDVFLGYCSASASIAQEIKGWLIDDGVTVLDWQTDFAPGSSILQQIDDAAARCGAGVFLFTRDDELSEPAPGDQAVPRDNVVFEAGYFIRAKGKDRVLIIREAGAKMPADLGGDIYGALQDRTQIGPIADTLRRFAAAL
jgi:CAP12/Pycsar effector protein, TIR domain